MIVMNKEEIDKILEELNTVNPSHLNDEALRLFNAIMSIADERDLLQLRNDKVIEYIEIFKNDIRGIDEIVLLKILKGDSNE